jgi:dTMP kinase
VIDGVDGCGKSTQAARLVAELARRGRAPLHLREPGGTALGEGLRAAVLSPAVEAGAAAEALVMAAARRQMLDERVGPALAEGRDVVCERFHPSTFAYQAVAGGLDEELVLALLATWAGDPAPDLVLLLDVDAREAARRRGPAGDRIEAKTSDYHEAVARGYARYAERVPSAVVIDGRASADEVARRVLAEVDRGGR